MFSLLVDKRADKCSNQFEPEPGIDDEHLVLHFGVVVLRDLHHGFQKPFESFAEQLADADSFHVYHSHRLLDSSPRPLAALRENNVGEPLVALDVIFLQFLAGILLENFIKVNLVYDLDVDGVAVLGGVVKTLFREF